MTELGAKLTSMGVWQDRCFDSPLSTKELWLRARSIMDKEIIDWMRVSHPTDI